MAPDDVTDLGVGERHVARDELVHDDADRVDVTPGVELVGAALLGRHVLGRALEASRLLVDGALGDAEVADLHDLHRQPVVVVRAGDDDEILGLHVLVDDLLGVRVGETGAHLRDDLHEALGTEAPIAIEDSAEAHPVEVLHDEVEEPVLFLAEVENARDVRMVEPARRERLGVEAAAEVRILAVRVVEDLHRDGDAEVTVLRAIHRADAATADLGVDDELAPGERAADERRARVERRGLDALEVGGVTLRELVIRLVARTHARRTVRRTSDRRLRPRKPKAEREAGRRRRPDGIREEPQRLPRRGRVDLEHVLAAVDGGREERDEGRLAREGDPLEEVARSVLREICHEHR